MLIIVSLGVFLLTFLVIHQLLEFSFSADRRIALRLKEALNQPQPGSNKQVNYPAIRTRRSAGLAKATPWLQRLVSSKFLQEERALLDQAGVPLKIEEFLGLSLLSGFLMLLLGVMLFKHIFPALLLAILGILLPAQWVRSVKKKRVLVMEGQLLNAVVLLANSLRAGHSFMQALELVSRETSAPLGEEFNRVLRETRMGVRLDEALSNFSRRVDSREIELLVTGILIQREVGGNLAEILDTIADTIDKRVKMRAKLRALTAQGRLSGWVVSLLPFALVLFIYVPHPEYARLMLTEPLGRAMLLAGLIMMITGILVVKKVVNIDV